MSTSEDDGGRGAITEDDSPFDEAHLEAILKDLQSKASLLKKMGLGVETRKDQHPTPSGTTTGGWPPYPLTPLSWPGWPGFSRLFLMGRLRHMRSLCPRGGKGVDRKASGRGESEALELVEFDPKVKPAGTWEPPQTIRNFLEKHFNKSLSEGERESIMTDFPKPNVDAVVTPKLGGDAVEQLKSKGKNPHFTTEKALGAQTP